MQYIQRRRKIKHIILVLFAFCVSCAGIKPASPEFIKGCAVNSGTVIHADEGYMCVYSPSVIGYKDSGDVYTLDAYNWCIKNKGYLIVSVGNIGVYTCIKQDGILYYEEIKNEAK